MQIKTVFFFSGSQYWRYDFDPVTGHVRAGYPLATSGQWPGMFGTNIDTAFNLGNGKVYFFSGSQYLRYDVGLDAADPGYPLPIAGNWGTLTRSFPTLDAAVNWGNGKVYFFKGNQYVRWQIDPANPTNGAVDPGYPQPINGGNWGALPFTKVDAAFNAGNGKAYFFSGTQYARIDVASHTMDSGYPQPIAGNWDPQFSDFTNMAAVEWPLADPASTLNVPVSPSGCVNQVMPSGNKKVGQTFAMQANIVSTSYPTACACAEYRQFVRGTFTINGVVKEYLIVPFPGAPAQPMLPIPAPGSPPDTNFLQDGVPPPGAFSYGHRSSFSNIPADSYLPDRGTGCSYSGTDFPALSGLPTGTSYSITLDFLAKLVDHQNDDSELTRATWSVNCIGVA